MPNCLHEKKRYSYFNFDDEYNIVQLLKLVICWVDNVDVLAVNLSSKSFETLQTNVVNGSVQKSKEQRRKPTKFLLIEI